MKKILLVLLFNVGLLQAQDHIYGVYKNVDKMEIIEIINDQRDGNDYFILTYSNNKSTIGSVDLVNSKLKAKDEKTNAEYFLNFHIENEKLTIFANSYPWLYQKIGHSKCYIDGNKKENR